MKKFRISIFIIVIFSIFLVLSSSSGHADPPVTVLVFPFTIHAADDQAFLRRAVMDMLFTRLSGNDRTIVFQKDPDADADPTGSSPMTEKKALEIGRDKNADYILMGSLTILGESVSTDARLIRAADQQAVVIFNRSGQGQGAVIEHVDALAAQITRDVFVSDKPDAPSAQPVTESQKAQPFSGVAPLPSDSSVRDGNLSYWKSENLKTEINSLAIGDVTGDGKNEIVFVDGSTVYIYRYSAKTFSPIQIISEKTHNRFIRVDAADINQNGIAEIFITNYIPLQKRMQSFVLEWNGTAYEKISEKANWYYRVVNLPEQDAMLLGQKCGPWESIVSVKDALFEKDVYELKWQDGKYLPADRQDLPDSLTLYGYAVIDVVNKGQKNIVAFSGRNYLTVMNLKGEVEWKSDEPYGGSTLFFEVPDPHDAVRTEYFYLPQRIFVTDFDNDGSNEIIVVKNHDAAGALARVKYFNEGVIECLSYDAIGAQLKWQTRKISGYISDYAIADCDNDGQNDLVFASVTKGKSVFSKGLSAIIVCSVDKE